MPELPEHRSGSGQWRFLMAETNKIAYRVGETINCRFTVFPNDSSSGIAYLSGLLIDQQMNIVSQFDSRLIGTWLKGNAPSSGVLTINGVMLKPGRFSLELYLCGGGHIYDIYKNAVVFDIISILPYAHTATADAIADALVLTDFNWRIDEPKL